MIRPILSIVVMFTLVGLATPTWAQRGGDRGGDEGGRESRWGGRGGDEGGRSRFGGGFPGGGFPGGGFPGGGGPPWGGGGFSRGGDSGRGGFGGGGFGGFNPADMVRRFDRNNNNMIEPDEAQGPAQFFLQRMAQNNPKIDLSKPIPIDLLTGEMERMRGGGGDDDGDSGSDEPQLLIPDFSLDYVPPPVATFGVASAKFTVKVTERDIKEAEDRMRRYDQNRDGSLSADELRGGRWGDDPMQFDRNRDGKLTATELAVRYANRRIEESQRDEERQDDRRSRWGGFGGGGDDGWTRSDDRREESKEEEKRFGDAKSYRLTSREEKTNNSKGLPDFFARSDADGDGQVFMHEFSSSWNDDTLAEFVKWDLNADGAITARECLAALEKGARVSSSTPSGSSSSSSASSSTTTASSSSSGSSGSPDAVQIEWAKRQIGKYDQNNDGQLTAAEWEKMLIKPTGADTNGDGVITVDEYAAFRAKK